MEDSGIRVRSQPIISGLDIMHHMPKCTRSSDGVRPRPISSMSISLKWPSRQNPDNGIHVAMMLLTDPHEGLMSGLMRHDDAMPAAHVPGKAHRHMLSSTSFPATLSMARRMAV